MGTPVTDPKLLAALNSDATPASGQAVTDPKLLALLNGDVTPTVEQGTKKRAMASNPGLPGGSGQPDSTLGQMAHGLGLAANSIVKGAGAAPAWLLDMATSPLRDTSTPGIGRDIQQLGYTALKPSDLWAQAVDKLIPSQPQNTGERVAQFVGQMGGGMLGPAIGTPAQPQSQAASQLTQNLQTAGQNGIKVTPGEAHAGPFARMVEGIGGKGKLALKNQVMNQDAMNTMMRQEFGLPEDTQFTPELFTQLQQQAADAGYKPLQNLNSYVRFGQDFRNTLGDIADKFSTNNASFPGASSSDVNDMINSFRGTGAVSGKDAIAAIRALRQSAPAAFNSNNPLYNPAMGNAKIAVANAIEDQLGKSLAESPETAALVPGFQAARNTIARLKAAQDAFMPASGMWNAKALTSALNNGAPLTGNLQDIAQMAGSFPKSMRVPIQGMPPAVSGAKILGVPTTVLGALMMGHPAGAAMGLATLAPDAARGLATSSLFQNNLLNGTGALYGAASNAAPLANDYPALLQYLQQQGLFGGAGAQPRYPPLQQQGVQQ